MTDYNDITSMLMDETRKKFLQPQNPQVTDPNRAFQNAYGAQLMQSSPYLTDGTTAQNQGKALEAGYKAHSESLGKNVESAQSQEMLKNKMIQTLLAVEEFKGNQNLKEKELGLKERSHSLNEKRYGLEERGLGEKIRSNLASEDISRAKFAEESRDKSVDKVLSNILSRGQTAGDALKVLKQMDEGNYSQLNNSLPDNYKVKGEKTWLGSSYSPKNLEISKQMAIISETKATLARAMKEKGLPDQTILEKLNSYEQAALQSKDLNSLSGFNQKVMEKIKND